MPIRRLGILARIVLISASLVAGYNTVQYALSPQPGLIRAMYALSTPGIVGVYAPGKSGDGFGTIRARWMPLDTAHPTDTGPVATRELLVPNRISDESRAGLLRAVTDRATAAHWRCSGDEKDCQMSVDRSDKLVVDRAVGSYTAGLSRLIPVIGLLAGLVGLALAKGRPIAESLKGAGVDAVIAVVVLVLSLGPAWTLTQLAWW